MTMAVVVVHWRYRRKNYDTDLRVSADPFIIFIFPCEAVVLLLNLKLDTIKTEFCTNHPGGGVGNGNVGTDRLTPRVGEYEVEWGEGGWNR